ncbi:MAG: molybdopterin molybdotransferase MoeA, partial [Acidobacteriota bacterium]
AAGRVLARPILADRDQPPFARSTRDGYACRAAEASRHEALTIAGAAKAGDAPAGPLPQGAAWEIMTGAPAPAGADAVMMVEHVETSGGIGTGTVRLLPPRTIARGENIVERGAQGRVGEELLASGARVHAGQIALAASCGYAELEVFARPRVAIVPTGDEIVAVEAEPGPGQIRNSNGAMLAALVAAAGGEPLLLAPVADTDAALDAAIAQARGAQMMVFTGGVSAGKFDLVEPALARAGARFHFTGVRIQPGKPTVFAEIPGVEDASSLLQGQRGTKCCMGLPGNPVSSMVTFLLFGAPLLAALAGDGATTPRFAMAQLAGEVRVKPGLTRFLPAVCSFGAGGELPEAAVVSWQGSGDLTAMARSNCFLVAPEDLALMEAGATVRILLP